MMMTIKAITAYYSSHHNIYILIKRMRTELMMVLIIMPSFQICVSGVCGAPGQPVQSRAAAESGSATGDHWPFLRAPAVRASRHRARAATQDSAQVQHFI